MTCKEPATSAVAVTAPA